MLTFPPFRSPLCSPIRYRSSSYSLCNLVNVLQMKGLHGLSILSLCYFGAEHHILVICKDTNATKALLEISEFLFIWVQSQALPVSMSFWIKQGFSFPSPGSINRAGLGSASGIRNKQIPCPQPLPVLERQEWLLINEFKYELHNIS